MDLKTVERTVLEACQVVQTKKAPESRFRGFLVLKYLSCKSDNCLFYLRRIIIITTTRAITATTTTTITIMIQGASPPDGVVVEGVGVCDAGGVVVVVGVGVGVADGVGTTVSVGVGVGLVVGVGVGSVDAAGVTETERVFVLLVVFGSDWLALTVALLTKEPVAAGAVTLMVIGGAVPTLRASRVKVSVVPAWLKLQPSPEALTNVTPAGSVAVTLTDEAKLGPAFVTFKVYEMVFPAVTEEGPVRLIVKSDRMSAPPPPPPP